MVYRETVSKTSELKPKTSYINKMGNIPSLFTQCIYQRKFQNTPDKQQENKQQLISKSIYSIDDDDDDEEIMYGFPNSKPNLSLT